MQPCEQTSDPLEDAPDVATALCHELHLPLAHLLDSLDRAHEALRRRPAATADQPSLQLLRSLADAHTTTRHLLRVVGDVHGQARVEPRRTRRLDLRVAVRAAAMMTQTLDGDIAIDAPQPAWVDGVDTRLVHLFAALFADALADERVLVASVRSHGDEVIVELRHDAPPPPTLAAHDSADERSRALGRAVVRHIVAAHGGRIERWPNAGAGIAARVTLPSAPRICAVSSE
jgi:signal transduction histidine kinase